MKMASKKYAQLLEILRKHEHHWPSHTFSSVEVGASGRWYAKFHSKTSGTAAVWIPLSVLTEAWVVAEIRRVLAA